MGNFQLPQQMTQQPPKPSIPKYGLLEKFIVQEYKHPQFIQQYLDTNKPFQEHLNKQSVKYKMLENGGIYIGQVNQNNQPHGYGKIIHVSGQIQIGIFVKGKANGQGVIVMKNGSFYQGQFKDHQISGKGRFKNQQIQYKGQFLNGIFDGQGKQITQLYTFQGIYDNGTRLKGLLKWKDRNKKQCQYQGFFNQNNKFIKQGRIKNTKGQFQGLFQDGFKNGFGKQKFKNGLLFHGEYRHNKRNGQGQPQQDVQQNIAFKGVMVQGVPHGQGQVYKNGKLIKGYWINGQTSTADDYTKSKYNPSVSDIREVDIPQK